MAQYTALGLMIEQLTGYEFVEYVHWIQYAHIYANQFDAVDEMLDARAARAARRCTLTEAGRRDHRHPRLPRRALRADRLRPPPAHHGIPVLT